MTEYFVSRAWEDKKTSEFVFIIQRGDKVIRSVVCPPSNHTLRAKTIAARVACLVDIHNNPDTDFSDIESVYENHLHSFEEYR